MKRFLKNVTYVFVVVFAVVLLFSGKVNAKEKVLSKCTVGGSERTLVQDETSSIYLYIDGEKKATISTSIEHVRFIGFDKLGTVYYEEEEYAGILWYRCYDLEPNTDRKVRYGDNYINNFKKFKVDSDGLIVSIVTNDGKQYPTLSMKGIEDIKNGDNYGYFGDFGDQNVVPVQNFAIKHKGEYKCLYVNNAFMFKYKLKKSKLTYKVKNKKSITVKGVKMAGYTLNGKLIFLTKKGVAFTIDSKGKKKCVKKKAKKIVISYGFAVKVDNKKL